MGEKKLFNRKFLLKILIALIIGNTVLIVLNINFLRKKKDFASLSKSYQIVQPDFFNSPCPDIEMTSIQGKKINLYDLKGDVTIIKFTLFHYLDLPHLHYLEHVYRSFENEGLHLLLIYPKGRQNTELIDEFIPLSIPIIEDDGFILSKFSVRLSDTLIIGRDLKIKLKSNLLANRSIFNQVVRFLYEDKDFHPIYPSDNELSSLINRISYLDIKNGEMENLGQKIKNKYSLINIFISTCFSCKENKRIRLMKELISEFKGEVVFLFGRGNNFNSVKQFSEINELENFTVGIIQPSESLFEDDYYRIFKLDVDPRIFILKENGEIQYKEELKDQRKINLAFLLSKIE